jgi:hypothetical protein
MAILVANNATSYLAGTLTAVATSLTVSSGTGTIFPTLSGSDVFYVTLTNTSNQNEIVKVTAKATDTFTIVRAQDGTSALAFAIGDKVELRVIKVVFDDKASLTNDQTFSGANVFSGSSTTDLVRITQTGTGNSFVVEDSTNPDTTPFVINASGSVVRGYTSSVASASHTGSGATPSIQNHGLSVSGSSYGAFTWVASSNGPNFIFSKSRGATAGTNAVVSDGDLMGGITFAGDDGDAFITGATITGLVDGTPGNNDMPGRLVFNTTADGASTPTERMRITSTGSVGIGSTSLTTSSLRVSKDITGGTSAYGVYSDGEIQSDVTSSAFYFGTNATAVSGTLTNLIHYRANQSTLGTTTVSAQYGFQSDDGMIGATNNYAFNASNTAAVTAGKTAYGFRSDIDIATGGGTTYGFYAEGTAVNYFNGNVGIGETNPTRKLDVAGTAAATYFMMTSNTASAPAVDAAITRPADGTLAVVTNSAERLRIASAGQIGIGGANYGTSGQILTSGGAAAAPSWANAPASGATGGGSDAVFVLNDKTITTSYTIASTKNASSVGPLTINSGVVITISSGSRWVVL